MLNPLFNRQRLWLLVVRFTLLSSIYLMTYSAGIDSGDSRRALGAVSSFVDYGELLLVPPARGGRCQEGDWIEAGVAGRRVR